MAEDQITVLSDRALAAKQRAEESSKIDHAAIYRHVAENKPQLFGAPQFETCPQCDQSYRIFNNPYWKGYQSVCQACADENFSSTREKMQAIEAHYAKQELQHQALEESERKELPDA